MFNKENLKKTSDVKTKEVPLVDKVTAVYANLFKVEHTQEEFHFAFIIVSGEMAEITSKVIITPGHMKRLIETMQENLRMYEEHFGEIASTPRDHSLTAAPELPFNKSELSNNHGQATEEPTLQ